MILLVQPRQLPSRVGGKPLIIAQAYLVLLADVLYDLIHPR